MRARIARGGKRKTPYIYVSRASQFSRGFHGAASLAGFRQFIEPIAAQVNVAKTDIYANTLLFNADGSFKGHLESEPTSRAGGKAKVGRRPDRCRCRCWCWCLVWLRDDVRVLSDCRLSVCHGAPMASCLQVVADLKAQRGYKTVVMIGDGATDMEARDIEGGADAFIGFGGIAVREKVKAGADWFVLSFQDMIDVLKK